MTNKIGRWYGRVREGRESCFCKVKVFVEWMWMPRVREGGWMGGDGI